MSNIDYGIIPSSLYRLQFNAQFTFKEATKILPYLKDLGIEGVYCSPYFQSFSDHGYDVTDPNSLNKRLGTWEDYLTFCQTLQELGLKQILDIVPNHMGIKGGENIWWQDVLENGPYSEYASYFDINWSPEKKELQDRVLLPILGMPYDKALEEHQIQLLYQEGKFWLNYTDYSLPVNPHTYAMILESGIDQLQKECVKEDTEWLDFQEIITLYRQFPVAAQERITKKEEGKLKLIALLEKSPRLRKHLEDQLEVFNGKKKKEISVNFQDSLLEGQFYRLSYWRVARHEINYRRFFNIPELVSIRMEEEKIFESYHYFLFQLIDSGYIHGLRIDHPDGLYDPAQYFKRLRQRVPIFTVIEKILGRKEKLVDEWEVEGTVGYEYLNYLNGIFIEQQNEGAFSAIYEEFSKQTTPFEEILYQCKKFFTNYRMVSEVETLGLKIDRLSETHKEYRDFTRHELTEALIEIIAFFPIYRTYIQLDREPTEHDCHQIKIAIEKAKQRAKELDLLIFDFIERLLMAKLDSYPNAVGNYREFAIQFQQLTAPIMAKGMEDTAFYNYNRFISLNEVGGDPVHFGYSAGEFHAFNLEKRKKWPYGLLASSTHDTKRSEDVRARLNVLSEIPEKWKSEVNKWTFANNSRKPTEVSQNIEYYIYQTLLGIWPSKTIKSELYAQFCQRVWDIILKSLRESKENTNWVFPNTAYEESVHSFLNAILKRGKKNAFLRMFSKFHRFIDYYGALNSLSQAIIKIASPGVAEIYQGNEMLTYRLIDPDNRMPIDFSLLRKNLKSLNRTSIEQLVTSHNFSKAKMFLISKALEFRCHNRELFLEGEYIPLKVEGEYKENVIAFARKYNDLYLIILAGRFFTQLNSPELELPIGKQVWGNTHVLLPRELNQKSAEDLFTTRKTLIKKKGESYFLPLAQVFANLTCSYLIINR